MTSARHVADGLGCADTSALKQPARLQGPVDADDQANVCGVAGFRLPEAALFKGKAEPGTGRVTGGRSGARACELTLRGPGEPRTTLTVSDGPAVTQGVRRDESATTASGRAVTTCSTGDLYVGVSYDDAYRDLLLDQGKDAYEKANTALFASFSKAIATQRGCPHEGE